MKQIFWTQNESPTKLNTFIIDGVMSDYKGDDVQDKAMKILVTNDMLRSFDATELDNFTKGKIVSEGLKVMCTPDKGILLHGKHPETDEAGRTMPFAAWNESMDVDSFISYLRSCASKVGKTFYEDDLQVLESYVKAQSRKQKKVIYIIIAVIILMLLWITF